MCLSVCFAISVVRLSDWYVYVCLLCRNSRFNPLQFAALHDAMRTTLAISYFVVDCWRFNQSKPSLAAAAAIAVTFDRNIVRQRFCVCVFLFVLFSAFFFFLVASTRLVRVIDSMPIAKERGVRLIHCVLHNVCVLVLWRCLRAQCAFVRFLFPILRVSVYRSRL